MLNPLWENEEELFAEFDRFGIDPARHLLVADSAEGRVLGLAGFLRHPQAELAALYCPIVASAERGRGLGGELLRAAQRLGADELGVALATAAIGTRNRAGYSLLSSHGFRPLRQHFLLRCDAPQLAAAAPGSAAPELELSEADAGDAAAILEIYAACGFETRGAAAMGEILRDGRHAHAVARRVGRVVAFAELDTHWRRRVWVAYVGVVPELRDRGVGTALVRWALERQFGGGATSALLLLSPANRTALRAYEKAGFRRHRLVDVLEKTL